MLVDCVRRRFDTVSEANTHRYRREIFIKHFCNTKLVIYDIIIFGKSYVISIFEFLVRVNGEIVFQKFSSCFEHLSSKYLRIEYFRILTTKFVRHLFSSQQDFPYFLNLFLRYWVFRRTEFIYGTDCDETVLLLTGAWWSTTYLTRELVYHAMSSMSSKISIT